jgi:DNA polymerase-3 subunit beta
MSRESYPELPEMPEVLARIPIGLLASMIGKTIFSIAAEETRFTLNGALLLLRSNGATMVATDGHRLAMVESDGKLELGDVNYKALLPKKAMAELLKLSADTEDKGTLIEFAGDDNHLFFRMGERLLISRKLTGNFPDFERVLPKSHGHSVELSRDELRASIDRVSQFSDERSRAVKMKFADGELTLFSSTSEAGESEETLPVEYAGAAVEVSFNASYLLDFLRALPEEKVTFHFRDGQSAGELRPAGEGISYNYRYVVMPMRI